MNPSLAAAPATVPLRLPVHFLIAVAVGIVAPFTALAWPFALLTGFLLGSDDARHMRGERQGALDTIALAIVGAGGIIAMLFFGAIVGGIIAIGVVALAVFSERTAAFASPTDRGVARILLFVVPILMWVVLFPVLGIEVAIDIGS